MYKNDKSKRLISFLVSMFLSLTIVLGSMSGKVRADTEGKVIFDSDSMSLTITGKLTEENVDEIKRSKVSTTVEMNDVECDDCSELFKNFTDLNYVKITGLKTNNAKSMFENCSKLRNIDIDNWDMSTVTNMSKMFTRCSSLVGVDVSSWDVSNVTDMSHMFEGCVDIPLLDVSKWNTSKVRDMSYLFSRCFALQNLDVSKWNVSDVTNMEAMFFLCRNLQSLDVKDWDVSKVQQTMMMFSSCLQLENLDVSNWRLSGKCITTNSFMSCPKLPKSYDNSYTVTCYYKGKDIIAFTKFANTDDEVTEVADSIPNIKVSGDNEVTIKIKNETAENKIVFNYIGIFQVRYFNSQGKQFDFETVDEGSKAVKSVFEPTKEPNAKYCYTFEKWTPDRSKEIYSDTDFYPVFKETLRKYPYSLIYRDRKTNKDVYKDESGMADYGETIVKKPGDIEGYKVISNDEQSLEITEKDNAIYFYVAKVYPVKFVNGAGETIKEYSLVEGEAINSTDIPNCPEKEATPEKTYKPLGWDRDLNNIVVTEDEEKANEIIIKPKYQEITNTYKYTVVYKCGDTVLGSYEKEVDYNTPVTAEEKTFAGYKEISGQNKSIAVTEKDMVITVNYTKLYTITFTDAAGNVIETKEVEAGQAVEAPKTNPVKAADAKYTYIFEKWDKALNNITENVEFKPVYSKVINKYPYSIVYRCGDNILKTVSELGEYDSKVSAKIEDFEGYKFKSKSSDEISITEKDNVIYVDYEKEEAPKEDSNKGESNVPGTGESNVPGTGESNVPNAGESNVPSTGETENPAVNSNEKVEDTTKNEENANKGTKNSRRTKAAKTADNTMASSMLLLAGMALIGMLTALKTKEKSAERN